MRIISVIAIFALATAVCADVTPRNSGMAEATSLQTRSLRGEVHGFRRPRKQPEQTPGDSADSADPGAVNNYVSPPRREKKASASEEEAPSTENGNVAAPTRRVYNLHETQEAIEAKIMADLRRKTFADLSEIRPPM
jgi:hypothetical protein